MARLIDADALIEDIKSFWDWNSIDGITSTTVLKQTITDINHAPTIDAVPREDYEELERHFVNWEPVVRCKDCKWKADTIGESWCDFHEFTILSDDDYCSYGERRNDEID